MLDASRVDANGARNVKEQVAEEVPVALTYNGISHAVMMASPRDLEDFALGFSLSEGIVTNANDIIDMELREETDGISLDMQIIERHMRALKDRRRNLVGRTGCGLCGADSLAGAIRPIARVDAALQVTVRDIQGGFARLAAQQTLNHATGAVHAAGLIDGEHCLMREDIGRHNALDKLIGAMHRENRRRGFLVVTSRASYEMVHKAASANIALIAAISAPSALAIDLARAAGMTLIGFARPEGMTIYTTGRGVVEVS